MSGETNLEALIKTMKPVLNTGKYVFCTVADINTIDRNATLFEFKEAEGATLVLSKDKADAIGLDYSYVASWITLTIHSSLDAVGLTAKFSNALAKHNLSCNVVAGYYHDHIFVDYKEAQKALEVLEALSRNAN